ncbi:carbohydrate esterase family 16 protein [Lepidopterella palustris CBS 459.81]|uniref:Carbohydrate esterase family 16 protein n=1 Tax=Lepidopterella palustris CBS 459.81 TaxID=1314670 RepID=A0A8E2EL54_9PEZI|nr:carbohydrate esterase family 16 protein [Lepidopterella palustris CBS 459.81]
MRCSLFFVVVLTLTITIAIAHPKDSWSLKQFKSFVAFGDSYTDEDRILYFATHNGSAPPVGWVEPMSLVTSTGGLIWSRYVSIYTSANLYNYAVSGAVCSNSITPRTWNTINAPFPDIAGYELPSFLADAGYQAPGTHTPFLILPPHETVYAIWIGTNDLGNNAFLTDSQVAGKTIVDYMDCVYATLDGVYKNGGRYFVIMNAAPLQLAPMYATPANGGLAKCKYWPDKPSNITEISCRMWESVVTVNDIYKYRTPFEVRVERRYPGAHFAIFDVNGLMTDIWDHPTAYLNGTAPANVTGYINHCNLTGANCTEEPSPDSFMWYDELHPSEQTDRVIAKSFVDVVRGESKWATYWC